MKKRIICKYLLKKEIKKNTGQIKKMKHDNVILKTGIPKLTL